ncbi:MAG: acetyltransferase [Sphingomonadales bacterium]|nr:acetyltransferase [Sphingomonadales bacterium]
MPLYTIAGLRPCLPDDGSAWVAPSADIIGDVRLGQGASVWFGAVIRADNTPITVGNDANIQEGAMLHSDPGSPLKVGKGVTVGHHAILHGCTIGDGALVGMGATVLNDAVIGENCLIGAGALITQGKAFPANVLIVGSPAKAVRELSPDEIAGLAASAKDYASRAVRYATLLKPIEP